MNTNEIRYETGDEDGYTYHRYVRVFDGVDPDGRPTRLEMPARWMRSRVAAQFAFIEEFPGYAVRTIFGSGGHTWSVTHDSPVIETD